MIAVGHAIFSFKPLVWTNFRLHPAERMCSVPVLPLPVRPRKTDPVPAVFPVPSSAVSSVSVHTPVLIIEREPAVLCAPADKSASVRERLTFLRFLSLLSLPQWQSPVIFGMIPFA